MLRARHLFFSPSLKSRQFAHRQPVTDPSSSFVLLVLELLVEWSDSCGEDGVLSFE